MKLQLLIPALILAAVRLDAQVYAVGFGPNRGPLTVLRVDEHRRYIGSFGLVQFRSRSGEGAPWVRQTTIQLGTDSFSTRLPAITIAALMVISLLLPLTAATLRFHCAPAMTLAGPRKARDG